MADLGLNAGFGFTVGTNPLDEIANMGFVRVRQDYVRSRGPDLVQEFVLTELQPLFLIAGGKTMLSPELIAQAAGECAHLCKRHRLFDRASLRPAFEIVNEPNLSKRYKKDPLAFAQTVNLSRHAIRKHDPTALILSGGVLCTARRDFKYLEKAVGNLLPDIGVAFHSYHERHPPQKAHKGFKTRAAEIRRIKGIVDGRFLACTEIGRHSAPQTRGWLCFKKGYREDWETVAKHLEWEIKFLHEQGILHVDIYQHRDGKDRNCSEDNFGVLTVDGKKKPIAEAMPGIAQEIA